MTDHQQGKLVLTKQVFLILMEALKLKFIEKNKLKHQPKNFQYYGYGDYKESIPSLKKDFDELGYGNVNGKYLYNKKRSLNKGIQNIKISKYYQSIILEYLGYKNILDFLKSEEIKPELIDSQKILLIEETDLKTYYYVSYYFGEDNQLLKGETIISENFKKIEHVYYYPEEDGSFKKHYSIGTIYRREDTIHIYTKTLLDNKLVIGGNEIYYIGHNNPSNTNYLIGTYSTFDIYTQTVAGKSILEKCNSKEEMEERTKNKNIPHYIAIELRNQRIINKNIIPSQSHEISANSPYSSIYGKLPGEYTLEFISKELESIENLNFKILKHNYSLISLSNEVYFESNDIQLHNKGSVVQFSFCFSGLMELDQAEIYFKTYFLTKKQPSYTGVFSGVDKENRLIHGEVTLRHNPC